MVYQQVTGHVPDTCAAFSRKSSSDSLALVRIANEVHVQLQSVTRRFNYVEITVMRNLGVLIDAMRDRFEQAQALEVGHDADDAGDRDVDVLHRMRGELDVPGLAERSAFHHLGIATRSRTIDLDDVGRSGQKQVAHTPFGVLMFTRAQRNICTTLKAREARNVIGKDRLFE